MLGDLVLINRRRSRYWKINPFITSCLKNGKDLSLCLYFWGKIDVRLRAKRLEFQDLNLYLAASTHSQEILKNLESIAHLKLVVVDSIQTMSGLIADSVPGKLLYKQGFVPKNLLILLKRNHYYSNRVCNKRWNIRRISCS